ncbi:hypothetical protein [Albidovulum sp.]|uniref:hypothetical protein n=1 Tax=Albidovulum sp. TaxID=1872424 RepID=UPI003528CA9E
MTGTPSVLGRQDAVALSVLLSASGLVMAAAARCGFMVPGVGADRLTARLC